MSKPSGKRNELTPSQPAKNVQVGGSNEDHKPSNVHGRPMRSSKTDVQSKTKQNKPKTPTRSVGQTKSGTRAAREEEKTSLKKSKTPEPQGERFSRSHHLAQDDVDQLTADKPLDFRGSKPLPGFAQNNVPSCDGNCDHIKCHLHLMAKPLSGVLRRLREKSDAVKETAHSQKSDPLRWHACEPVCYSECPHRDKPFGRTHGHCPTGKCKHAAAIVSPAADAYPIGKITPPEIASAPPYESKHSGSSSSSSSSRAFTVSHTDEPQLTHESLEDDVSAWLGSGGLPSTNMVQECKMHTSPDGRRIPRDPIANPVIQLPDGSEIPRLSIHTGEHPDHVFDGITPSPVDEIPGSEASWESAVGEPSESLQAFMNQNWDVLPVIPADTTKVPLLGESSDNNIVATDVLETCEKVLYFAGDEHTRNAELGIISRVICATKCGAYDALTYVGLAKKVTDTVTNSHSGGTVSEVLYTENNKRVKYRWFWQKKRKAKEIKGNHRAGESKPMEKYELVAKMPIYVKAFELLREHAGLASRRAHDGNLAILESLSQACWAVLCSDNHNAMRIQWEKDDPQILVYTIVHYLNQRDFHGTVNHRGLGPRTKNVEGALPKS